MKIGRKILSMVIVWLQTYFQKSIVHFRSLYLSGFMMEFTSTSKVTLNTLAALLKTKLGKPQTKI